MNRLIGSFLCASVLFTQAALAQTTKPKTYRNFPVVVSVQFHNLAYPLEDLKSNVKNPGIGIGTEIALGNRHGWAQQFQALWYHNKHAGDGILLYTQSAWRPALLSNFYGELKAGAGITYTLRPVIPYKQQDGAWSPVGRRGKWLFTVPAGFSLGYNKYSDHAYIAPFASYQLLLQADYNNVIPIMTNSLFQVGGRIHL